jgi:hypothetical protein
MLLGPRPLVEPGEAPFLAEMDQAKARTLAEGRQVCLNTLRLMRCPDMDWLRPMIRATAIFAPPVA